MSTSDLEQKAVPPELRVKVLRELPQRRREKELLSGSKSKTPALVSNSDTRQQVAAKLKAVPPQLRLKVLRELAWRCRERELLSGSEPTTPEK